MKLGAFSISLTVKDIARSRDFYTTLGFEYFHGDTDQGWLLLKNGDHIIGLFHNMFEKNMLTFNPGWDQTGQNVDPYTDVREIKDKLLAAGINVLEDNTQAETGPGSFIAVDPDGNPVLIDQHR